MLNVKYNVFIVDIIEGNSKSAQIVRILIQKEIKTSIIICQ